MKFWEFNLRLTFWSAPDLTVQPNSMVFVLPGTEEDYVDPKRDFDEFADQLLEALPRHATVHQRFELQPQFPQSREYHDWRANVAMYYLQRPVNFLQIFRPSPWDPPLPNAHERFTLWTGRYFDAYGQLCLV